MQHIGLPLLPLSEIDREIDRRACAKSFAAFVQRAWHVLEPATELKWGWALDAICAHLEAVSRGEILNLLINVPPGCMKSLLVGVLFPAWEWGPRKRPDLRYIGTAHKQDLAVRDNLKCRRLIQSEWYQSRWPILLTSDQNAKTKFENDATGFREAMAFTSTTGSRGDRLILDDPLSVDDANSEANLNAAEITFTEALPTRLNSEKSAKIVIMQRLHERDTSGLILSRKLSYVHLCLPMEFEAERRCQTVIGFEDPRQEDGELLFPERFPQTQVDELKRNMGSYATAGQFQQRPVPREGGMFKRHWFDVVAAVPAGGTSVRGWDLAATKAAVSATSGPAYTAGVKVTEVGGVYYVEDVRRERGSAGEVERLIKATAQQDGEKVKISIPQDPGQAGKAQVAAFARLLAGFNCRFSPESGKKEDRALPVSAQAEAGNIKLVKGDWNDAFLDEVCLFPGGTFKDQTDALSRAMADLFKKRADPINIGAPVQVGAGKLVPSIAIG